MFNRIMFGARFMFYGMIFGAILGLFGITGIWGFAVITALLPVIFWADEKYMKPLKESL